MILGEYLELRDIALTLAVTYHNGQVDKAGQPYILHLLHVSQMTKSLEGKIVGLLHDILEDTTCTPSILVDAGIPTRIVEAVICISRVKDKETYQEYIKRVAKNPLACEVKLSDLKHHLLPQNRKAISDGLIERYKKAFSYLQDVATAYTHII